MMPTEQADRVRELVAELRTGEHVTRLRAAIASFAKRIATMEPGPARDNEEQWQAERIAALALEEQRADALEALTAERDGLREGLEPFARLYDETVKCWPGTDTPRLPHRDDREAWGFNNATLMWGDFRTARALLTPPAPHSDEAGSKENDR